MPYVYNKISGAIISRGSLEELLSQQVLQRTPEWVEHVKELQSKASTADDGPFAQSISELRIHGVNGEQHTEKIQIRHQPSEFSHRRPKG